MVLATRTKYVFVLDAVLAEIIVHFGQVTKGLFCSSGRITQLGEEEEDATCAAARVGGWEWRRRRRSMRAVGRSHYGLDKETANLEVVASITCIPICVHLISNGY